MSNFKKQSLAFVLLLSLLQFTPVFAAAKAPSGQICKKKAATTTFAKQTFICKLVGKKLLWTLQVKKVVQPVQPVLSWTEIAEKAAADKVIADAKIRDQLKQWEAQGYGDLPVCMAKTQYSFTTDPNRRGAPTGHSLPIREVRLSAGAGFVVVICGDVMTMPGLPRVPSAETIRINENGLIDGLF